MVLTKSSSRSKISSSLALRDNLIIARKLSEANLIASVGLPFALELKNIRIKSRVLYMVISDIERRRPPTISRGYNPITYDRHPFYLL